MRYEVDDSLLDVHLKLVLELLQCSGTVELVSKVLAGTSPASREVFLHGFSSEV